MPCKCIIGRSNSAIKFKTLSVLPMAQNDFKTQELPLARIKKIMKLDDDVKVKHLPAVNFLFSFYCSIAYAFDLITFLLGLWLQVKLSW